MTTTQAPETSHPPRVLRSCGERLAYFSPEIEMLAELERIAHPDAPVYCWCGTEVAS